MLGNLISCYCNGDSRPTKGAESMLGEQINCVYHDSTTLNGED